VPQQYSSGNKIVLGSITKRGDRYIRTLLIHGARTVIKTCENKTDNKSQWLIEKKIRIGFNKTAVALANKNARTIWAMVATGESYRKPRAHNELIHKVC
jgi:transposase